MRLVREHRQELVAQTEQARGLEADDGDAARDVRRERVDHAARLGTRFIHHAGREEGPPAAQGAPAIGRTRDVHAVAGRFEDTRAQRVRSPGSK